MLINVSSLLLTGIHSALGVWWRIHWTYSLDMSSTISLHPWRFCIQNIVHLITYVVSCEARPPHKLNMRRGRGGVDCASCAGLKVILNTTLRFCPLVNFSWLMRQWNLWGKPTSLLSPIAPYMPENKCYVQFIFFYFRFLCRLRGARPRGKPHNTSFVFIFSCSVGSD